jgi:hypothetical protein
MAEKKVIGRPFEKGVSGNPFGRSKHTHYNLAARQGLHRRSDREARRDHADGQNEQAQVRAAEALLDRGWGRPAQHVGSSEGGEPIQIF